MQFGNQTSISQVHYIGLGTRPPIIQALRIIRELRKFKDLTSSAHATSFAISTKNIKKHIIKLYEDFVKLLQTRDSRKNESYDAKVLAFNKDSSNV